MQVGRAWGFVRTIAVGFGSLGLAALVFSQFVKGLALGLLSFGVCVLCLGALVLWESLHPPAFTVDVHRDTVEYEFRDPARALEFARINGIEAPTGG